MLERTSPLAAVLKEHHRYGPDEERRLRIGESRGWSLLQVTAFPATAVELNRTMQSLIGARLPERTGEAITVGARVLMKTGPEQFWIVNRDGGDGAALLQSAVAQTGSVVPLSHSRTCIWIEGFCAREVLVSAIAVDLHPEVFRPASFALTGLHHTPVLILRSGDMRYELYVLRTFAVWTWEWLTDAALPFGYEVVGSQSQL